jgi:hypothetical protein
MANTHQLKFCVAHVLEGLHEFKKSGSKFRQIEILNAEKNGVAFLLNHHLFQSHRTGEIIDKRMLRLSFPSRWRYDILRALDYLQCTSTPYDHRMNEAIQIIEAKKRKVGTWPVQEKHKGEVHFDMEKTGGPSRWNTLRALRVLTYFQTVGLK